MKAIILAAGKSPRLLPLTKNTPQSMIKVGSKTILELQVENLKEAGVEEIIVVTGYLSRKLEGFCKNLKIRALFNPFYSVSGMAASLWIVREELKNGFLFLYADVLFDLEIIKGLLESRQDICLAIKKNGLREEAEKVVERDGLIKKISKEKSNEVNSEFIGIAKFSETGAKKLIKELENIAKNNLDATLINVIDNLIRKQNVIAAYDIKRARFIDIDFPENLKKAKEIFLKI